jgi:hypothetical protein
VFSFNKLFDCHQCASPRSSIVVLLSVVQSVTFINHALSVWAKCAIL